MNAYALTGTIAAYVALALLLLSLNFVSLWRWWIKAGAIIVTTALFVLAYFSITGMIGWPSTDPMPERFSLLKTRIIEPDKLRNTPGHIYLWIEEIDDKQIVIGPPRGYEVPYDVDTATKTATAQNKLDAGGDVLGEFQANSAHAPDKQANANTENPNMGAEGKDVVQKSIGRTGEGAETIGDAAALTFSDMPAVELPDKGMVTLGN